MTKTILGTSLLCLCVAFTACGGDEGEPDGSGAASGAGGTDAVGGQGGADNTSGGGGEAGESEQPGVTIELRGRWTSDFGDEIIDHDVWGSAELIEFSNDENIAITRNADDAEFNPSEYNRIVWTEVSMASFYYCTTDFGLSSLVEAREADGPADDSDPAEGGCGTNDFSWTKLSSNDIEIFGTWSNQFGGTETIDALTWTTTFGEDVTVAKVVEFSNEDDEAITQNPADSAFDPSKFNRIVWNQLDGFVYYCTTDFGLDTLEEAQEADTEADVTNPDEDGCAGNPWTKLSYAP